MKLIATLSAGLIAMIAIPGVAPAQMHHDRVVTRNVIHTERDRGYGHHTRRVCKTERRGHHRTRVCRIVRY